MTTTLTTTELDRLAADLRKLDLTGLDDLQAAKRVSTVIGHLGADDATAVIDRAASLRGATPEILTTDMLNAASLRAAQWLDKEVAWLQRELNSDLKAEVANPQVDLPQDQAAALINSLTQIATMFRTMIERGYLVGDEVVRAKATGGRS